MNICRLSISSVGILLCLFSIQTWCATTSNDLDTDDFIPFEGPRFDDFDWNLFKVLESTKIENTVISIFSIKWMLAMLYEGATGVTENELAQVLRLPVSRHATRERYQAIIQSLLQNSDNSNLTMGSRVFLDSSLRAQKRFSDVLKLYYDTEIKSVNFKDATAASKEINNWATNLTKGLITNLVKKGDLQHTILLLANTIYFKGMWQTPFPKINTASAGFYLSATERITVPYMANYGLYYYCESSDLDAKILRLPFVGYHISMYILLPNAKLGLTTLLRDIHPQILRRVQWLLDRRNVYVYLPRFQFEFNSKLGPALQKLGLHSIFQNNANLNGLARTNSTLKKLMVSNIIQKAGIEVNEEGSMVWASTVVTLENKAGVPEPVFNASHPFLFFIEDELTGNMLFTGTVKNPVQI